MSASYSTPDAKKEEFRKYLDKSGVVDALTKGALRNGLQRSSRCLPPRLFCAFLQRWPHAASHLATTARAVL